MVRSGRPSPPSPAVAGEAAARGRAGRPGRPCPVPAVVARHRPGQRTAATRSPRSRRAGAPRGGRRPARGPADPGQRPRARHPAGPDPGYQPRLLDELGAMGEVAWVGRGSLGRDDGRIVLVRPGRGPFGPVGLPDGTDRPDTERHERLREHLRRRGASFYRELFTAAGGGSDREVLDALWDLVWAGEVTNDTFAPLRALRWKRTSRDRRPRPGRLTSLGPPEAAGRWSLVDPGWGSDGARRRRHDEGRRGSCRGDRAAARHRARAPRAVRRPGARSRQRGRRRRRLQRGLPGPPRDGGAGPDRRGYVVDGLGGAQFALPGAIDRLRALREPEPLTEAAVHLLAAADPANPYGGSLPWPRRDADDRRVFQRAAGAYVVMVDGGGGPLCRPRRRLDPAVPRRRRPGGSCRRVPGPHGARRGRTGPGAGARARSTANLPARQPTSRACSTPASCPAIAGLVLRSPALDRRAANGPFPAGPVDPSLRRARSGGGSPDARVIRMGRG